MIIAEAKRSIHDAIGVVQDAIGVVRSFVKDNRFAYGGSVAESSQSCRSAVHTCLVFILRALKHIPLAAVCIQLKHSPKVLVKARQVAEKCQNLGVDKK